MEQLFIQTYIAAVPVILGYIVWILKKQKSDRDERSCYLQITGAGREALNKDYKKLLAPAYRMYRKLGAQKFKLFMEIVEEANGELQNGKDDWQ